MDQPDEPLPGNSDAKAQPNVDTVKEASRILDALATLSVDLACHCDVPPHTLVLPAGKVSEVCSAIDQAVLALKRILTFAAASGLGPVPGPQLGDLGKSGAD
jgi:hypothetical protein